LAVTGGLLLALAPVLPDSVFGVVNPGTRIFMPGIILLLLASARSPLTPTWQYLVFGFCVVVFVYNVSLFKRFDDRAHELTAEIARMRLSDSSFCVLAFDWAEDAPLSERLAPSINGMSFIPVYDLLSRSKPSHIFETGLLRMSDSLRSVYPEVTGSRLTEWTASLISRSQVNDRFGVIYVFGDEPYMGDALRSLSTVGFGPAAGEAGWQILMKEEDR
jgi:hypothetical protein